VARQKLGQHFLSSAKVLERIATVVCGDGVPLCIEIGPGKGALTRYLLERSRQVIAIELDPELAQCLRDWNEPRLDVVEANALDADWPVWEGGVLVGNLPYYIATAIISKYVRGNRSLKPAVFLIQKEVAARITAVPGTREYGYFSVECQLLATVEYLFTVPPGAFRPPPKVDSAVIRLNPRPLPTGISAEALEAFLGFVSACFRQKRKTLRNNLSVIFSRQLLGGRPEMIRRAEQLTVEELVNLYRSLVMGVN
jgi:16S rRNA (adenine1518-N6/adenine1519-N6)-dimethyltransferase